MTDAQIRTLLLTKETQAFERIYKELSRPVYTVALRITGNKESAEDVLQDTFIKLFTLPPEKIQRPRAYIFAMAHNLAVNNLKQKKADEVNENFRDNTEHESKIADRIAINSAMAKLAPSEAAIVNLHLVGGLKFKEVADILSIPMGTTLWKYRKAIKKLQDILREEYL